MFDEINICLHCKEKFNDKEPLVRWISSNILKFDFKDNKNFKYIYPYHHKCFEELKISIDFMKNLTINDLESGTFNVLIKNTKKHIDLFINGPQKI